MHAFMQDAIHFSRIGDHTSLNFGRIESSKCMFTEILRVTLSCYMVVVDNSSFE
jgi:hypothetical protein